MDLIDERPLASDRPKQISRALQTADQSLSEAEQIYEEFVNVAQRAVQVCNTTGILVEGKYKLVDALPSGLNPTGATNTLLMIFQFYSKIKTSSVHTSFAAAEDEMKYLSFSKLEIFCRDFMVVPKLLTREDIKILWQDIGKEHVLSGRGTFTVIDFDQFRDLIVRMALWAYHKPGLKKLIVSLEGFMPDAKGTVDCFCRYLKLHNLEHIHNFLRTVGRNTQGELNYRSKGEVNLRTKLEVRADTDAKKLSQTKTLIATTDRPQTTAGSSTRGLKKLNAFGEVEEEVMHTRGAHPGRVIAASSTAITADSVTGNKKKIKQSLLPPSLLARLTSASGGNGGDIGEGIASTFPFHNDTNNQTSHPDSSDDEDNHNHNHNHNHNQQKKKTNFNNQQSQEVDDNNGDDNDSTASSSACWSNSLANDIHNATDTNSLAALRSAYLHEYNPRLAIDSLASYCYEAPVQHSTDLLPTKGPVIDLGRLAPLTRVKIIFRVSNGTGDDLQIDATARGFLAPDTHVATFTRVLAAGLARVVTVTFTIPAMQRAVLGLVDILCISLRSGESAVITAPVFYHASYRPSAHAGQYEDHKGYPVCTAGSLPDLIHRGTGNLLSPAKADTVGPAKRRVPVDFSTLPRPSTTSHTLAAMTSSSTWQNGHWTTIAAPIPGHTLRQHSYRSYTDGGDQLTAHGDTLASGKTVTCRNGRGSSPFLAALPDRDLSFTLPKPASPLGASHRPTPTKSSTGLMTLRQSQRMMQTR